MSARVCTNCAKALCVRFRGAHLRRKVAWHQSIKFAKNGERKSGKKATI